MNCPGCKHALTMAVVFENLALAATHNRWLGFDCPWCGRRQVMALGRKKGLAWLGCLDGFPGPAFIPEEEISRDGLRAVWLKKTRTTRVTWKGTSRTLPQWLEG